MQVIGVSPLGVITVKVTPGEDQGLGGRSQEEVKEDRGQAIKVLGNLDKGRF